MISELDFLKDIKVEITPNASLSDYTTFRLGGKCPLLISCFSPKQLEAVVTEFSKRNIDFLIIGNGSNILASDKGVEKTVIRYVSDEPVIKRDNDEIIVTGSTLLDQLAAYAASNSLACLNFLSGIPGTVAGAITGNAGAYGKQIGDSLLSVEIIMRDGTKKEVGPKAFGFEYRYSNTNENGAVILSARFKTSPCDKHKVEQEREDILRDRREKHPDYTKTPTAGSFFKNLEPPSEALQRESVGWFLEQADAKNMSVGGATVFEKHANMIINSGKCKAQDVFDLSKQMDAAVSKKFNRTLIREVKLLGSFEGMPEDIETAFW